MINITHRLLSDVPMMHIGALTALHPQAAETRLSKAIREYVKPQADVRDGVAAIPVDGVLAYKPNAFEMLYGELVDSRDVLSLIESASVDPDVKGILLEVNSPGGFVNGGPEVADAVANSRKPVVAWTGGMMASLAYWIGSQADSVIAARSAQIGSIGVMAEYADYSKMLEAAGIKIEVFTNAEATLKATGYGHAPMTSEQRDYVQSRLDGAYKQFKDQVLRKRKIPSTAMKGQTFYGSEAKGVGLVDAIGDRSFALSQLRSLIRSRS